MNKVLLNGKYYDIVGDIRESYVNPWTAKLSQGEPVYSDISQGSLKEYHDFRGGVGLESELGGEVARLWWSEGVNTSIEKCLIMGPKVTTAGTFGDDAYTAWAADTAYSKGAFVKATTYNDHIYECTTAGTSDSTEPTPWKIVDGQTNSDNTATWTCRSVQVVDIFDFLGSTYAYAQNMIAKWNTGTSAWDAKETGLADPIGHKIVTDETSTYAVAFSATTSYNSEDGTTWSEDADMQGYPAVIDHRLCGFTGNTLYFSPYGNIDGTIGSKAFSGYLGTVYGMFEGKLLTTGEPCLYIHSNEGLFALDFWTKQIYKQEVSFPPYTYAGHAGTYWNSYVWVSTGPGIKKITPSLTTDVGPDQDDGLPSGYQGVVYDMEGTTDWLVYCVNGGTANKSSIFKRHGTLGGNHQIYTTSAVNKEIRCVHISPSSTYTRGRLWWSEDIGIKYCDFPDFNANPMEISGYTYATTGGKCTLPIFRPLAVIPKVALRCQPLTENCTANRYVTLYYDLCEGDGWVSMGNFTSSPLPTAYPFASGVGTPFYRIKFGVEMTTDSATETPKLESLMFTWMARPSRIRSWVFTVTSKGGEAEDDFTNLQTAADTNTLLDFYPSGVEQGTANSVVVTSLPSQVSYGKFFNRRTGKIDVTVQGVFSG